MDKTEAETLRDATNTDRAKVFCPLINGLYQPACICYKAAKTEANAEDPSTYRVLGGYCNNAMFWGEG